MTDDLKTRVESALSGNGELEYFTALLIGDLYAENQELEQENAALRTPDMFWDNEDPEHGSSSDVEGVAEAYPMGTIVEVMAAKQFKNKFAVWLNERTYKLFDTRKEAEQTLAKGGECQYGGLKEMTLEEFAELYPAKGGENE